MTACQALSLQHTDKLWVPSEVTHPSPWAGTMKTKPGKCLCQKLPLPRSDWFLPQLSSDCSEDSKRRSSPTAHRRNRTVTGDNHNSSFDQDSCQTEGLNLQLHLFPLSLTSNQDFPWCNLHDFYHHAPLRTVWHHLHLTQALMFSYWRTFWKTKDIIKQDRATGPREIHS